MDTVTYANLKEGGFWTGVLYGAEQYADKHVLRVGVTGQVVRAWWFTHHTFSYEHMPGREECYVWICRCVTSVTACVQVVSFVTKEQFTTAVLLYTPCNTGY